MRGRVSAMGGTELAAARTDGEQVAVLGDVAAELAGGGEGQAGDAVPGRRADDELAGVGADLLLGGGRQVRRLGGGLARAGSVMAGAVPGCWPGGRGRWGKARLRRDPDG
jgi:hypothetical protein